MGGTGGTSSGSSDRAGGLAKQERGVVDHVALPEEDRVYWEGRERRERERGEGRGRLLRGRASEGAEGLPNELHYDSARRGWNQRTKQPPLLLPSLLAIPFDNAILDGRPRFASSSLGIFPSSRVDFIDTSRPVQKCDKGQRLGCVNSPTRGS